MTTLVPTSEEDPSISIVRFTGELSWADAGPEVAEPQVTRLCVEAQQSIIDGKWLDLASLMLTSADLIFSKASDKDLECVFTVICNLVKKPENLDQVHQIADLISSKVAQQPSDKPALRLKILFNLFNSLENPQSRFLVYMKALDLAVNGKVTDHVLPSFKHIDSLLGEWNLGVEERRELFLAISHILKGNKSSAKESFKFLNKYLATFSGEDENSLNDAKEEAVNAVFEFIKSPDIFQCDLLDMPAVTQLDKDDKYALVYQLLKIFSTQRLDAYLSFHAVNSSFLESHEDPDEIFRKMKETRLVPNVVAMVNALCKDGLAQEAIELFGLMHEKGTIPEVITYTAVVEGYCKAQKLDDAIRIFRKMQSKGVTPNAHSYGILIQWLCKVKRVDDAVEFCGEMIEAGHSPNTVTFMGLVDRFCREKGLEEAQKMIISLRQKGFYIDEHSCREYLEKKGPSPPQVWEAVLGKKPSHIRSLTSLFHYE